MANSDLSDIEGTQEVLTYTIGFGPKVNTELLTSAATATKSDGSPGYFSANDYDNLLLAFQTIVQQILATSSSFVSPSISVNAFNRFSHLDQLYYALFKVDERPQWFGNVKRYKLSNGTVVDVNDVAAVDSDTGFFKETAQSWWSSGVDGDAVKDGGAAGELGLNRNVYTYTGGGTPQNALLTNGNQRVRSINDLITKAMLGDSGMSDNERSKILSWASGIDVKDADLDGSQSDGRSHMGDPLHSVPLLLNLGGTEDDMKLALFIGTNEGYLHAIDPDDGTETFSFIPPELLTNLSTFYRNEINTEHPYGLDGPISKWHNDLNHNGMLYTGDTLDSGESMYVYAAMRRGGKNYYALDVTNIDAPKYAWRILGGQGLFAELGQSWSRATHAKIKLNGTSKDVLIFGGGYDADQDDVSVRTADSEGRAIFMVDAATGAKIWQAGPAGSGDNAGSHPSLVLPQMAYSIPSEVVVIDTNRDGYGDRMYVGDMGGQLWRFDIDNDDNSGAADLVSGGVIADLAGSGTADNRRFYYPPAVAYMDDKFYLAIGSGFRAHPLDNSIHDAMFVIKDTSPLQPLQYDDSDDSGSDPDYLQYFGAAEDSYITLTSGSVTSTNNVSGDLFDATSNVLGSASGSTLTNAEAVLEEKAGWYITLNDYSTGAWSGEKVLSNAVIFDSVLMFSTFMPTQQQLSACAPDVGTARFYQIDMLNGKPYDDPETAETDESSDRTNRYVNVAKGGIPPEPVVILPPGDANPVVMVGPEKVAEAAPPNAITRTSWQVLRP
ncbi:MAG: hypothetical protein HQL48_08440 [Gammaproteobacteria bacterium]|nr:hypothetical protein [Gammaproteobacteria bacterium]